MYAKVSTLILGFAALASAAKYGNMQRYVNNLRQDITKQKADYWVSSSEALADEYFALVDDNDFQDSVSLVKEYFATQSALVINTLELDDDFITETVSAVFGDNFDNETKGYGKFADAVKYAFLPASFDGRTNGWVTSVKDQKDCGSCVAFSATAGAESSVLAKGGVVRDFSEADVFFCLGAGESGCVKGWYPHQAGPHVQRMGLIDDSCFSYTPKDQACKKTTCTRTTGFQNKLYSSVMDIKTHMMTHGSILTGFMIYDAFPKCCTNNNVFKKSQATGKILGGHAISCYGWDDSKSAWMCKNSWTTQFGTNGHFLVEFGAAGIMGASSDTTGETSGFIFTRSNPPTDTTTTKKGTTIVPSTATTTATTTITTVPSGEISNGIPCKSYGAWACGNACQCAYAGSGLSWYCPTGARC